jgi:predicted lipid-binding transport protein (Tim44 family)
MMTIALACLAFAVIAILFREFGKVRGTQESQIIIDEVEPAEVKELQINVDLIKSVFPDFELIPFIEKAERLLLLVLEAFTKSDYDTLSSVLTADLYESFVVQIQKRDKLEFKQEILVQHKSSSIDDVQILDDRVSLLVSFCISQMSAIYKKDGSPVDNPNKIYRKIMHKWTFERMISDANWLISKTSLAEI